VSKSFQCTIITPEASVFDGEVTYARFPAWDGQYGMMAGLSPLLSSLAPGGLRLDEASGSRWFLVEGGFAHVVGERLTILAEAVTPAEELDVAEAEAAFAELRSAQPTEDMDMEELNRQRQIARDRVHLARRNAGFTTGV
tara:strand:+ start:245 stop:664 length:420 start_codon:yes stop_codon:yes gene_type:complete